jgi:2'-5' RNA ligase
MMSMQEPEMTEAANNAGSGLRGELFRAFIAIELDHTVLKALDRVQGELKREVPPGVVRWVKSSGIHLTLKFLGDVPAGQIQDLDAGLQCACGSFGPFTLAIAGLGCYPNPGRPRVVWVGVEDPGCVVGKLQQSVEREIAPLGYSTEARPFSPHLTLGRAQRNAPKSELRSLGDVVVSHRVGQLAQMEVSAVSLIRSDLRPSGAVYTPLAQTSL